MTEQRLYELWLENVKEDIDLKKELKDINGNSNEIYERFYKELEFGTAGLRGIIGAGTNRMNIYTVRRTTQGLADYLNERYEDTAVAIAYDSRMKSDIFSMEAARVLAANGIKVYMAKELQPTPVLSFMTREFNCNAGIMITASHNPAKYNGYKCFGPDGCQMTDVAAGNVYEKIQKVDTFSGVKVTDFEKAVAAGIIEYVKDEFYEKYLDCVESQAINKGVCNDAKLKVVYTPLNGAGNKLVRQILKRIGIKDVVVVKEQENPDGTFKTCPYPNPEIKEALALALDLANSEKPDLVLATDPDSDRVGIAVRDRNNEYKLMSGNEVGILLINYILSNRKKLNTLPENPVAVKTIVSSEMVNEIAKKYNCELRNVMTGFKYIGEQILDLEKNNEENRYVFGFEESYGYLIGTYVRDKDAVVASMLICEMAAFYLKQGKNLLEVLSSLYDEFGYYKNKTLSFSFEGAAGMKKMQDIMDSLRENPPKTMAKLNVTTIKDYKESVARNLEINIEEEINLPKSNVLSYTLEGGSAVIVRPSGTEPKIKVYVTSVGYSLESATDLNARLEEFMKNLIR